MAANAAPVLTPAQYLATERAAEFRSEYVNGEIYAMSGGLLPHAQLMAQFSRELADALEHRPCLVTVADLRLQVTEAGAYLYPDVMVICDKPAYADGHRDMITNPSVVVEVLSESTERWDRGGKFVQYRQVASLREYVLVSQTEMRVEWFTRGSNGEWLYREAVGVDGVCRLQDLGIDLKLERVYRKVEGLQPAL